jgi:hypothetical protein
MASLDDILKLPPKGVPGGGKVVSLDELVKLPPKAAAAAPAPEAPDTPSTTDPAYLASRARVGLSRPEDTLATIRQAYPDAEASDQGTAVFTDPTTHRKTYFNKPGPDLGDLAAGGRTLTTMAGNVLGGMAGAALGTPAGPGGMFAGGMAGAGAGGVAAGAALDYIRKTLGAPQTFGAGQYVEDFATGAAGELAGQGLAQGVKYGAKALVRPGADATVQAAKEAGVPLTAAMVTRGIPSSTEQRAAQVLPLSKSQRVTNQLYETAGKKIDALRIEPPPGVAPPANAADAAERAGEALKDAADRAYQTFKTDRQALDNDFYAAMPRGVRIRTPNVQNYEQQLRAELARRPGDAKAMQPVLDEIGRIKANAAAHGGALPPDVMRTTRTNLFQETQTPEATARPDYVKQEMRLLYDALNDDLRGAANQVSPPAAAKLAEQDKLVRDFRGKVQGREAESGTIDAILKKPSNEAAFSAFTSGGVERLHRLAAAMSTDEHRLVARAAFERLGADKGPATWASKWLETPPAMRREMFGRYVDVDEMDALAQVLRRHVEGVTWGNPSKSGYEIGRADLGKSVMRLAAGLFAPVTGAPAVGFHPMLEAAGLVGGYGTSALVSGPRTLRALVRRAGAPAAAGKVERAAGQAAAGVTMPGIEDWLLGGKR